MKQINEHIYAVNLLWTGNKISAEGQGTRSYTSYERCYEISAEDKPVIQGSADAAYRGDAGKYNPEEMLVAALSSCHMLWYLHLCADNGITVVSYSDKATGYMQPESAQKDQHGQEHLTPGRFTRVILTPDVTTLSPAKLELATRLHHEAHRRCFIANSVNFEILIEPRG